MRELELSVQTIDTVEGLHRLESDWRALADSIGSVPFASWEWNVAWWTHLARRGPVLRDELSVRTVRDRAGNLVGVAPLVLTALPCRSPLRFRYLQFFGADPNLTEIRGVVCRPDSATGVYLALLRDLGSRPGDWDWIVWHGIPSRSEALPLVANHPQARPARPISNFFLRLPASWDQFRSTRSRNVKESLRKCTNSLKRDGLVPVLRIAESGQALDDALMSFLRLHALRAGQTDTVRHLNVFETPAAEHFLFDVCRRYSSVGRVRVFCLELQGRVVATRIGFVCGKSLYLYYSGYDSAYAKYSVMTTLVAEAIKYAIAAGFETVNLSTGNDVSKTRWSPSEVAFETRVRPSSSLRGPIATAAYMALRRAYVSMGGPDDGWSGEPPRATRESES